MTQKLLTLPFRLSFGAARTAFDISSKALTVSTKVAATAIELLKPGTPQREDSEPVRPETVRRPVTRPPASRESRVNGDSAGSGPAAPPVPQAAPVTPPDEQPDTPLTSQQDAIKTLVEEEEVVAQFAEPGAEDGAGAQLDVEEPWDGYAEMNAGAIISRIDQADPAQLAVVELYEQTHKKRQTVLNAAAKRLRALSPPETE
jgi:hypothetical protein